MTDHALFAPSSASRWLALFLATHLAGCSDYPREERFERLMFACSRHDFNKETCLLFSFGLPMKPQDKERCEQNGLNSAQCSFLINAGDLGDAFIPSCRKIFYQDQCSFFRDGYRTDEELGAFSQHQKENK